MGSGVLSNRREERIPIHRTIEFTVQRYPNNYVEATALDYCDGGIRLSTDRQLLMGDRITVYWGQRKLMGTVAYCRVEGSRYSVGVKLAGR